MRVVEVESAKEMARKVTEAEPQPTTECSVVLNGRWHKITCQQPLDAHVCLLAVKMADSFCLVRSVPHHPKEAQSSESCRHFVSTCKHSAQSVHDIACQITANRSENRAHCPHALPLSLGS
jgi:hypothetical protein